MKKQLTSVLTSLLSLSLLAGCSSSSAAVEETAAEPVRVGLIQQVDQTSLNIIRDAILDEFVVQGYEEGTDIVIDYQNAAGKPANMDTIVNKFVSDGDDVIIAIATGAAQNANNYADQVPLVFSAVADPVAAGLVTDMDNPGGNVTGTSFQVQTGQILDLIEEMYPDAKTIGALYTPGEVNGVSTLNRFKEEAEQRGFEIIESTGTDLSTLQQAEQQLLDKCDVLFSPNDNIVASGMTALAAAASDAGVPYFTAADSMVMDGGLATVGIDYEELGRETARMAIQVLEGTKAGSLPVKVFKDDLSTYINNTTLKKLEQELPEATASRDRLVTFE